IRMINFFYSISRSKIGEIVFDQKRNEVIKVVLDIQESKLAREKYGIESSIKLSLDFQPQKKLTLTKPDNVVNGEELIMRLFFSPLIFNLPMEITTTQPYSR
ncbi:MAG: hypothetical protein NZ822_03055, partial [Patescibacteria group bacterium]|nr:hypothetical protein [Patescibacteria group bacterium]